MAVYLDYNATAPLLPEVQSVMQELLSAPLNASSAHAQGRRAKGIIEDSRRALAEAIGAFASEIVFVASGTEANNWALKALPNVPLFVSALEHSSVLKAARATRQPTVIPATAQGVFDMGALEELLPHDGGFLCSLMLANNETGALQPIHEAAELVHDRGGLLHCDAVQALGKIPVDFTTLDCDLMTVSAHKMGGPVGAAALIIRNGLNITPLLAGGGQEMNRRAGTENVAAIAGFAKAASLIDFAAMTRLRDWLDAMEAEIVAASNGKAIVFAKETARLPNTSCIAMPGVPSETQLIRFDLEGVAVSAGSACSSGRIEPSHVLAAMGSKESGSAIRISGGWNTVQADVAAAANAWKKLYLAKAAA